MDGEAIICVSESQRSLAKLFWKNAHSRLNRHRHDRMS